MMQPVDPITTIDRHNLLNLHLFGLRISVEPALLWLGVFMTFVVASWLISYYRSKYRWTWHPRSNAGATLEQPHQPPETP